MAPVKKLYNRLIALIALFSIELILTWSIFFAAFFIFLRVWQKFIKLKQDEFDYTVFSYLAQISTPQLTAFLKFITFMGSFNFLFVVCSLFFIYFMFIRRHHWYSLKVPVVAAGSITVNIILKEIFSRPRPIFPMEMAGGFSFPSGHAMVAFSFYGLLIYVAWREIENISLRYGICLLLLLLIHLIGLSRIYLRVHYASDVVAGFALGVIWLIISIFTLRKIEKFSSKKLDARVKHKNH